MSPARIHLYYSSDILGVKADVCICAIHRSRKMRVFPVSRRLSKLCGRKVQEALFKRDPESEDMTMGQIEMTDPGELLQFKRLMFICLRLYRDGNEQPLQESLLKCLEMAANLGHTTMAVPAFGTGGLNYPFEKVAQATVNAISLHNKQYGETSSVETVNIVLFDQDIGFVKTYLKICANLPDSKEISAFGSENLPDTEENKIDVFLNADVHLKDKFTQQEGSEAVADNQGATFLALTLKAKRGMLSGVTAMFRQETSPNGCLNSSVEGLDFMRQLLSSMSARISAQTVLDSIALLPLPSSSEPLKIN